MTQKPMASQDAEYSLCADFLSSKTAFEAFEEHDFGGRYILFIFGVH